MVKKYSIKDNFKGQTVGTKAPAYERKDKGKFLLNDNLSQKDMGYLYEVIKHPAIVLNQENETKESK